MFVNLMTVKKIIPQLLHRMSFFFFLQNNFFSPGIKPAMDQSCLFRSNIFFLNHKAQDSFKEKWISEIWPRLSKSADRSSMTLLSVPPQVNSKHLSATLIYVRHRKCHHPTATRPLWEQTYLTKRSVSEEIISVMLPAISRNNLSLSLAKKKKKKSNFQWI